MSLSPDSLGGVAGGDDDGALTAWLSFCKASFSIDLSFLMILILLQLVVGVAVMALSSTATR